MSKVYRYMSEREFYDLWNGIPLASNQCTTRKSRTSSEGFCFLGEVTDFVTTYGEKVSFTPEACLRFLAGIVSKDVLVELEVLEPEILTEGFGIYADPTTDGWDDTICIREYSTLEYSSAELEPVRYCIGGVWYDV